MQHDALQQSVEHLAGVGTHTLSRLRKLNIHTVQDLLFHLPHRYEDRTTIHAIGSLTVGMTALVCGRIELVDVLTKGRKSLVCRISDGTGFLFLKFFNFTAAQHQSFRIGAWLSCFAEVRYGYAGLEMVHPEYHILQNREAFKPDTHLTPVYPLTEGLSQQTLRRLIKQALQHLDSLHEWLPPKLLQRYDYPTLKTALSELHTPTDAPDLENSIALKRLAFEELLTHYLSLRLLKENAKVSHAPEFISSESHKSHFLNALPFQLTNAQQRVMAEIEHDCGSKKAMMRLVQGDVGSGKTVVAAYAALLALSSGFQVAVMAPTELLAEQHFRNFSAWFNGFETQVVSLTGQLKGKQRTQTLEALATGAAGIAVGTHALFQDSVQFHKLGLIIIDEQHRFGVHQRMALRAKGEAAGLRPHQLVMTATPIPRTLAMLQYSDLDISIIDELPPNRTPVVTSVIPSEKRESVIARINNWVANQRQGYWVCTLIEESEVLQCEAAEKTAEQLTQALPNVRVGLVHGRMKSAEKDTIMQAFKNHDLDLLVATTVIEVGVDVPNAGLMIIENPERLGLAQLHQLRGRVGRGIGDSYCILMYQYPLSDTAKLRLGILRDSNDGFVIAEKDLQLRGQGDLLGTRQTGQTHFKIADLNRDTELLNQVQDVGEKFFTYYQQAVQPLCHRWLGAAKDYAEV